MVSTSPTPRAVDLTITGEVQGVSYRATCAHEARRLALTGFVENVADGSVHVVAQGSPDDVESLIDWCHDGPETAHVDDVEVRDVAPADFDGFSVRR